DLTVVDLVSLERRVLKTGYSAHTMGVAYSLDGSKVYTVAADGLRGPRLVEVNVSSGEATPLGKWSAEGEGGANLSSPSVDPGYVSIARQIQFPTTQGDFAYGHVIPSPSPPLDISLKEEHLITNATIQIFLLFLLNCSSSDASMSSALLFPCLAYPPRPLFPQNKDYRAPPGTRPPLLVKAHGGPTSAATKTYSPAVQFFTSRGFAILDVDYRGSTGYGTLYRTKLHEMYVRGQVGRVRRGRRACGRRLPGTGGPRGPDRLAFDGGSAGGYTALSALAIAGSKFKAGASFYGVSDLQLLARDTHKFESRYLDGLVGKLDKHLERYVSRSPFRNHAKLDVPTVFFQGTEDTVSGGAEAAGGMRVCEWVGCGCDDCVTSRQEDSLRHSRSRINAYRALASPSLIALSSKDPILTAFELSWELRRLSFMEHEFRSEYQELRKQCQDFATALLDHTRSSYELEVLLNHDPSGPPHEHGERMHLNRLKLAIKLKQKKFVAHPNVQQLLASIWYEGLPGFRRKNMALQALEIVKIGLLFPIFSIVYILAPHTSLGQTMRKPFIKFICHSASYLTFLTLLILASQRIETVIVDWFGATPTLKKWVATDVTTRRGAPPSLVEWLILAWVFGLIWSEIKQLWDVGLREYVGDMWNVIDFITNALYVATIALRIVAYYQVQREVRDNTGTENLPRKEWDTWDPMLIAEGLFAAANIFSSLKLVYIFSVNPYLGPLQVSLSRMVVDILKFIFLYLLTLFAFSCGMNQLLWFYADLEKQVCDEKAKNDMNFDDTDSCIVWRRFSNLFETTQTLFWAAFGLIDLGNFELEGIKPFTRFWGMLMFGTYSVINVIVLLNLLIAMMNHSYQLVSERADTEWKFARSKLWISYFEEGGTTPPPFNIIPAPKSVYYLFHWFFKKFCGQTKAAKKEHMRTIRWRLALGASMGGAASDCASEMSVVFI
ncbi:hypothetical protein C7M84_000444, partial [Penaeus vannamei]